MSASARLLQFFAESFVGTPLRKLAGWHTPVFLLHRIADAEKDVDGHNVDHIRTCLEYVRKHNYNVISLEQLCRYMRENSRPPERAVVFTIDDGFEDQIGTAADLFSEFDVPLTCFVITNFIEGNIWPWDDQVHYVLKNTPLSTLNFSYLDGSSEVLSKEGGACLEGARTKVRNKLKAYDQAEIYSWLADFYRTAEVEQPELPPANYRPATWQAINQFVARGHAVGAHTCNHRILSTLSDEDSHAEITGSIARLEENVPGASKVFAYPTGRLSDFGEREKTDLESLGMLGSVSTEPVAVSEGSHMQALPRFALPEKLSDFIQYLSYIETLKNKLR